MAPGASGMDSWSRSKSSACIIGSSAFGGGARSAAGVLAGRFDRWWRMHPRSSAMAITATAKAISHVGAKKACPPDTLEDVSAISGGGGGCPGGGLMDGGGVV